MSRRPGRPGIAARRVRQRGQAVVELALLLPMLLLCCLGTLDFGRALGTWIVLQNAAREGAFFAASHSTDPTLAADVQTVVQTEGAPWLGGVTVHVVPHGAGPLPVDGTWLEQTAAVTAQQTVRLVTPVLLGGQVTLTAAAAAPEGP